MKIPFSFIEQFCFEHSFFVYFENVIMDLKLNQISFWNNMKKGFRLKIMYRYYNLFVCCVEWQKSDKNTFLIKYFKANICISVFGYLHGINVERGYY